MKNQLRSVFLFISAFIAVYFILCFAVPGLRIKLAAEPMEYFVESIKHGAFFKTMVSCIAALMIGLLPMMIGKKK